MLRTYQRKRPGSTLIEGVEELCRLCLGECGECFPIFTHADDFNIPMAARITQCIGLPITNEKNLPNQICNACKSEIEQFYSFRKRCELTYQKLKSHQQALRDCDLISQAITALKNNKKRDLDVDNCDSNRITSEINSGTNECLAEFLSKTLLDIGVLSSGPAMERLDQNISTIELEVEDGSRYTFELMEEDEASTSEDANSKEIDVQSCFKKDIHSKQPDKRKIVDKSETSSPLSSETKDNLKQKKSESKCTCETCGRSFVSAAVLRRHAAVHSAARPLACTHCPRRFKLRSVLHRHMLLHGPRPHLCSWCGRGYTQKSGLEVHARTHLRKKPLSLHSCPLCPKMFLHASGLSRHTRRHEGRTFSCGACRRRFTDDSALRRHLLHGHPPAPAATPAT